MKGSLKKSVPMGWLSATVGAIAATLPVATATGSGYAWFLVAAPVAAFLTGTALWWLLLARRGRTTIPLGVFAGATAGAVGHYVCWYVVLVAAAGCHALTGGCTGSLGEAPMNPVEALSGAGLDSLVSLFLFGWLTVPAGAILGGFLARAQRSASMAGIGWKKSIGSRRDTRPGKEAACGSP